MCIVCFHCQQVAEKYLKALLVLLGIEFEPIHNLPRLCDLAMRECAELNTLVAPFDRLNGYSVQVRYPDDWREIDAHEGRETRSHISPAPNRVCVMHRKEHENQIANHVE